MIHFTNRISDYLDDFISDDFEACAYDPVERLQYNNNRHFDPWRNKGRNKGDGSGSVENG